MRRIPELDSLRGIAAVVILLFHLRFVHTFPLWRTAVDLFFVLSGYLITTIILEGRGSPGFLRTFYLRRSLRIWPAYYFALGLVILFNPLLPRPWALDGLWQHLTYTQGVQVYWGVRPPRFSPLFLHSWTLAIEEQFYLIWPLLALLLGRVGIGLATIPLIALPVFLRTAGYQQTLLLTRCEGLAFGALLAVLLLECNRTGAYLHARRWGFFLLALPMLSVPLWRGPLVAMVSQKWPARADSIFLSFQILRLNLFYFALVGWVLSCQGHKRLRTLRLPPLVYLGRISYGLYLYHPIAFALVVIAQRRLGISGSEAIDCLKLALSFLMAWASWRFLEQPILSLKDRFRYDKRGRGRAQDPEEKSSGGILRGPHAVGAGTPHSPHVVKSSALDDSHGTKPRHLA